MDAVSEILLERSHETDTVARMVAVSLAAHVALIGAFTYLPQRFASPKDDAHVMTISLSGPPGLLQGHNAVSAKEVQQAVPDPVKPKVDAPPALIKRADRGREGREAGAEGDHRADVKPL